MSQKRLRLTLRMALVLVAGAAFGQDGASWDSAAVDRDHMVPMRDGIRLATDIYRPASNGVPVEGRLPVLLQRTPYDKSSPRFAEAATYFARHGYVVALQDLRGRYASEGEFTKYLGEGQDGFDTIAYLAGLPYVDGQVGMWGTSYAAHVQANAAKLKPPGLSTIVLNMGGMSNGWDHKVRNHGAFELQQVTWAFQQLAVESDDPVVRKLLEQEDVRDWLTALPLRKGLSPLSIAPNFEDYVLEMQTHGNYDDYWKHMDVNWVEYYDRTLDVPMLLVSGWYDSYAGGTVDNYVALSKRLKSPVRLLMGPWTHGSNTKAFAGDVSFGDAAAIGDFQDEFHLRWFDRYLKGLDTDVQAEDVRVFVMGSGDGHRDAAGRLYHGGYWRNAATWPLPGTRFTPYYFHADGSLSAEPPQERSASTTYRYDPSNPVPTIGGSFSSTSPVFEPGAFDQREHPDLFGSAPPYLPLRARPDVLVFQTAPLTEPVEVVGPILVSLHVSSSALDTDFTAKLIDVYPPSAGYPSGFEMNLTDGIIRARYRERPDRETLLEPGRVVELTITPFPTANLFKKGHRIRVDISSSNFPRFDVNPNTGDPLGRHRGNVGADNTVYHDSQRTSHIVLPILGNGG